MPNPGVRMPLSGKAVGAPSLFLPLTPPSRYAAVAMALGATQLTPRGGQETWGTREGGSAPASESLPGQVLHEPGAEQAGQRGLKPSEAHSVLRAADRAVRPRKVGGPERWQPACQSQKPSGQQGVSP